MAMAKTTVKKVYIVYRWYVVDPRTNRELNYVGYAHVLPPVDTWLKSQQTTVNMEFYTLNRKNNPPVQKKNKFADAIRKYGVQAFRYEVLDTVATRNEALKKKGDWIDHYNSCLAGLNTGRGTHSEQRVYQYDLNGILIAEYNTVRETAIATGYPKGWISNCLTGRFDRIDGFRFKYRDKIN